MHWPEEYSVFHSQRWLHFSSPSHHLHSFGAASQLSRALCSWQLAGQTARSSDVAELATQGVGRALDAFPPIQVQPASVWQSLQVFSTVQTLEQTSMGGPTGIPVLALQGTDSTKPTDGSQRASEA